MSELENDGSLTWEIKFNLLTNPNIVKAWLKAMGATYILCIGILIPVFAGTGEWDAIPVMLLIFLVVCAGLTLLGFIIMLLVMGNASRARFSLSQAGVAYTSMDKKAGTLARIAVAAGGFFGSPGVAGAGLLSISGEEISLPWAAVYEALFDDKNNTIRLRNSYRDLLHLYCGNDNFDEVQRFVQNHLEKKETIEPLTGKHRFGRGIVSTLLVILASLPLYILNDILDLNILLSLMIMLFSLATIWMIPLFGWVVLVLEIGVIGWIVKFLSGTRTLKLVSTYRYKGYELLDAGECVIILLSLAGMGYLAWTSIRALKGKRIPVLMQDQFDV